MVQKKPANMAGSNERGGAAGYRPRVQLVS